MGISYLYLVDPSSVNGKLLVLLYDYVMFYIFIIFFFFIYLVFIVLRHFGFRVNSEFKAFLYGFTLVCFIVGYMFYFFKMVHCYLYVTSYWYRSVYEYLIEISSVIGRFFSLETRVLILQKFFRVVLGDRLILVLDWCERLQLEQFLSNFCNFFVSVFLFFLRVKERLIRFIDSIVFYVFELFNVFMVEWVYMYVFLSGFNQFYIRNYYLRYLIDVYNEVVPLLEIESFSVIEKYSYYCINRIFLISYFEFDRMYILWYKRVFSNIIWSNKLYLQSNFDVSLLLELVWTGIPTLILVLIAIPSFWVLFCVDELVSPVGTVKCIGNQWYWTYEYGGIGLKFDSYMIWPGDGEFGYLRLLEVDNWLRFPVRVPFRIIVTSSDVIHSWSVPAFGIKLDGVPGRLNQVSFYGMRVGFFFGQCSELCGVNHAFMPIMVEVVTVRDFINFLNFQKVNS